MKSRLNVFALSALMTSGVILATPVEQQDQSSPAPTAQASEHHADPNRQLKNLTRRLTLSSDQQSQILPILTDREQRAEAVRNDASLSREERQNKLKEIRSDSETKLRAILTDAQRDEYDKMRAENQERARLHRETTTK